MLSQFDSVDDALQMCPIERSIEPSTECSVQRAFTVLLLEAEDTKDGCFDAELLNLQGTYVGIADGIARI